MAHKKSSQPNTENSVQNAPIVELFKDREKHPRENKISLHGALDKPQVSTARILLNQFKENRWIYLVGIFTVVLTNFAEIAIPRIVQEIVDLFTVSAIAAKGMGYKEPFQNLLFVLIGIFLIQIVGRIGWRITLAQQSHYVSAKMKNLIWDKSRFFPFGRLSTDLSVGELMNVATGDVNLARFIFGFTFVMTTDFAFILILGIAAMISIDLEITLWSLFLFPVLPPLLNKLATREGKQHERAQTKLSDLTELAASAVSTARLQRMTDSSRYWTSALDKKAKDYRDTKFEVIKTAHAFIPITGVAPILGYLVLIILGVSKINQGQLSIGEFVALQSYVFIIQGPLFELGNIVSEWQRGFTSLGRVLWVLRQEEENHLRASVNAEFKRENLSSLNSPHLKISNLNFGFEGDKQPILKEINLDLIPGDRLAVRGAIGSGKSTFLKICSGLERGYTGSLFLNGRPLKEIPHSELTQTIAYVPQKSFLFAATVRENIELDQSFSDKEIWHFLELAAIDSDIRALPNGLNTRLGEWGINLSGGQKQRLTIARALARKASIFVFDDCMSAIDTVTEDLILSRLNNLFKNEILIWAAHRDSTLRYCNKTLQLGKAYDA